MITVGNSFITSNAIGIGSTTTAGRNAGINTAPGTIVWNDDTKSFEGYSDFGGWAIIKNTKVLDGEFMLVGGGGGGGYGVSGQTSGAGGGGAVRYESSAISSLTVATVYPVTVGASGCLLYTSPSPRDATLSRMPSSA